MRGDRKPTWFVSYISSEWWWARSPPSEHQPGFLPPRVSPSPPRWCCARCNSGPTLVSRLVSRRRWKLSENNSVSSSDLQFILGSFHLSLQLYQSDIIVESSLDKVSPDEDLLNSSRLLILLVVLPVVISYHELDMPGIYSENILENFPQ